MVKSFVHPTAEVSSKAKIGGGCRIWHHCHVREGASLGKGCILGKNVYIDHGVSIGRNSKIQNNCSVYHGARIGDGVFIGPHVCIANDSVPRAITPDGKLKSERDWKAGKTAIRKGASIGACSVVLPGITIGKFAMVGAGSVVTRDVPEYALAYGNPAKPAGYVCICGAKITKMDERGRNAMLHCGACGRKTKAVLENDTNR